LSYLPAQKTDKTRNIVFEERQRLWKSLHQKGRPFAVQLEGTASAETTSLRFFPATSN
jgi:hypothetical protein